MAFQECDVPDVGFPRDVEDVSQQRNRADARIESDVGGHPHQGGAGRVLPDRFDEDPTSKNSASGVAGAGDQAQERIEANTERSARDANARIQPFGVAPQRRGGSRAVYATSPARRPTKCRRSRRGETSIASATMSPITGQSDHTPPNQ